MADEQFNFGEGQNPLVELPQLKYPLDLSSEGALKSTLEKIVKDIIVRHNRIQYTIPTGSTSFVVGSNYMVLTGAAAVTIGTIAGGREGMVLTLQFTDTNVTITDDATAAKDTVNLNGSFTSSSNDVISLIHNGTSWTEIGRSGGSGQTMILTTSFETAGRFVGTTIGTGSQTFNTTGLLIKTGGTATSSQTTDWDIGGNTTGEEMAFGSPTITFHLAMNNSGTDFDFFIGIGKPTTSGASITLTNQCAGFHIFRSGNGLVELDAVASTGATNNAVVLTTFAGGGGDGFDLIMKFNGTSSIDFYYRRSGGSLSSKSTLTGFNPITLLQNGVIRAAISNISVATDSDIRITGASYSR